MFFYVQRDAEDEAFEVIKKVGHEKLLDRVWRAFLKQSGALQIGNGLFASLNRLLSGE